MSLYNRYMYIGKYSETQVVSWVWLVVDELDRCIHTYSPNYHDGQVDHCIVNRHERVTVDSGFYVKKWFLCPDKKSVERIYVVEFKSGRGETDVTRRTIQYILRHAIAQSQHYNHYANENHSVNHSRFYSFYCIIRITMASRRGGRVSAFICNDVYEPTQAMA